MHQHTDAVHHGDCLYDEECRCEEQRYWMVLLIAVPTFVVELWGSLAGNSAALMGDAMHVFVDAIGVYVTVTVARKVRLQHADEHLLRASGARWQGLLIMLTALLVLYEGCEHFVRGQEMQSGLVLLVALLGLLANAVQLWIVERGHKNVTSKGLAVHITSDLMVSGGVIAAAILTPWTGLAWIDPVVSILIALFIWCCGIGVYNDTEHTHHH